MEWSRHAKPLLWGVEQAVKDYRVPSGLAIYALLTVQSSAQLADRILRSFTCTKVDGIVKLAAIQPE